LKILVADGDRRKEAKIRQPRLKLCPPRAPLLCVIAKRMPGRTRVVQERPLYEDAPPRDRAVRAILSCFESMTAAQTGQLQIIPTTVSSIPARSSRPCSATIRAATWISDAPAFRHRAGRAFCDARVRILLTETVGVWLKDVDDLGLAHGPLRTLALRTIEEWTRRLQTQSKLGK